MFLKLLILYYIYYFCVLLINYYSMSYDMSNYVMYYITNLMFI